jgi:two-component system NtrC family sensor kinase
MRVAAGGSERESGAIRWWQRMSVKLPAVIAAATLVILGTFLALAVRVQREHLEHELLRSAALFSDTIKSSTYHFMLENRRADVYSIIETIGRQDGVDRVRIFNKDGHIIYSTDHAEINRAVDKRAESCYACHASDQPIVRLALSSRSRVYEQNGGGRILAMVTPIYNERSCSDASCHAHPESQRVLGVVDVGLSLAEVDAGLLRLERRTVLLSSLALLGLAGIVAVITRRVVVRPVSRLMRATRQVARGDLAHEIRIGSGDEIGVLAASFNEMTGSLRRANEEIQHLMEDLERKVDERTAALTRAQAQLAQSEKLASLGKLAASIAHEINNPLSGILTSTKLALRILDEGPVDDRAQAAFGRNLQLVARETQRCSAIVRNMLDFARQREPQLKAMDVNACLDEALSLVRNQVAIQGIALDRRLATVPAVAADFGQIRQVFLNVLLNACEAMPAGGALTVCSRFASADAMVEVEVADTGPGIPPDVLPKIFDPFFTTKQKGTGLGLSVVYGVIERHLGKVAIRTEAGRGTAVVIRLPAAPDGPPPGP